MKKILPYILLLVVAAAVITLLFTGKKRERKKVLDERITFRKHDKIPYGTFVAFQGLPQLFPSANISVNSKGPGTWDSLSMYESDQALIIISPRFLADDFEMKKIIRFIENGNDVFISAALVSEDARTLMDCNISNPGLFNLFGTQDEDDSLTVSLSKPPFTRTYNFWYPGKSREGYFYTIDTSVSTILGTGRDGNTNFIHLKAGSGNLYFHLAPMAFTNYFLLRDRNIQYYEDVLSVISPRVKRVVWDEYYLTKRQMNNDSEDDSEPKGWLSTLWGYEEFRWALSILLFILLAYVLLEMRRKQRYIPVVNKPRNESLEFVRTIGRLYFDRGDHKNLSRKMAAYFLDHVRTNYKLSTIELDEEFIRNLQFKTGVDEGQIRSIVFFIRDLDSHPVITDHQLSFFHRQLESFYSKI